MLKRRLNRAGYEATLGGIKTPVIVGGSDSDPASEFEPAVNMSFHPTARHPRGEAFMHMRHIDGLRTGRTETETDGEIVHEAGGFKHIFKVVDDNLKWDMDFADAASVPGALHLRIRHSQGLSFHKQSDTPEGELENPQFTRPEVAGSYAVYMDKRDNKYQTGKVCHIYSPFFVDEQGAKSPLLRMTLTDIETNVKRLTLVVTPKVQAWLDNPARVGKIRLDPTLGYSTSGASTGQITGVVWHTIQTQSDATGGEIVSLHAYGAAGNTGNFKASVANCPQSSPYDPEGFSLIAEGEGDFTGTGQKDILSPTVYASILPNTWYRVGITLQNNASVRFDNLVGYQINRYARVYANEMSDPVPTTDNVVAGSHISVWAVYEPSAGQQGGLMGGGFWGQSTLMGGGEIW